MRFCFYPYLEPGCGGSSLSGDAQNSLSKDASSSSLEGTPKAVPGQLRESHDQRWG